jgi:hypothetical protein
MLGHDLLFPDRCDRLVIPKPPADAAGPPQRCILHLCFCTKLLKRASAKNSATRRDKLYRRRMRLRPQGGRPKLP